MAKMQAMEMEITSLKADLMASFEATLTKQLDEREVGGSGFARGNEIMAKLETLLETVSK